MSREQDNSASILAYEPNGGAMQVRLLGKTTGTRATVLSWGVPASDLQIPRFDGTLRRVELSYADISDDLANAPYLGATVGRCCSPIAQGRFRLDGRDQQLPINVAEDVLLHGGRKGISPRPCSDRARPIATPVNTGSGGSEHPTRITRPDGPNGETR